MSSLDKSNDSETFRNFAVNIAVIFGVLAGLIMASMCFASTGG